jgi:hypothetical protein
MLLLAGPVHLVESRAIGLRVPWPRFHEDLLASSLFSLYSSLWINEKWKNRLS